MSIKVCLGAATLDYPDGGGHLWAYLNWALGLRALGCQVIWMEMVSPDRPARAIQERLENLKHRLGPYGLAAHITLCSSNHRPLSRDSIQGCPETAAAYDADLLLNMAYGIPPHVVSHFRKSALLDIDPGLTQIWISEGQMSVARHHIYFTIGETIGHPGASFPDCGLRWHYTPPAVCLSAWPAKGAEPSAPYTTVTNWWGEWVQFQGQVYSNGKRDGFLPFLELPKRTSQPLELAICLGLEDEPERAMLLERGWRVHDANTVTSTPWDYQRYIQNSFGEFSCAKPSYVRLHSAWISDRTLCYLASGKPAVVQHTGQSRFLPDRAGLFRFRDLEDAVRWLNGLADDYERQCKLARALAEEYFDARKVIGRMLERALA